MSPRTCAQTLAAAQALGLERLDAQWLLLHALGKPADARAWLLAHDTDALDDAVARRFESLVERRAAGEPLAYVVGSTEFFGLTLQVDPRVLIPRPDTETLVNWSLEVLLSIAEPTTVEILDLGTGSGAIALALAHSLKALNRPAHVTAVDASAGALAVAGENAQRLGLDIRLIKSDWFEQVSEHLHLIASNPPYIASVDAHLTDLTHEPLAYVVGSTEFFGLTLQVDPRVLIPRPDTETLVNWSLEVLSSLAEPRMLEILDLGTGSGAIALALAHSLKALNRPAHVTAVDASADALAVAGENARRLGLNIRFIESDWFEQVSEPLHLIASNPPYIASADAHLTDLTHEPLEALTAGPDGLDDLRHIIDQGAGHLVPGGWLLLEHGYDQARQVRKLLDQRGFVQVQSRLDLAGIARCSGGRWPG